MSFYKKLGVGFVFAWFFFGGISHFVATQFYLNIMPPYIPMHLQAVYLSGFLEIIFALGLLNSGSRQLAGYCLIVLTLAVTPANVHMWLNPHLFPQATPDALTGRLVLQVFLLACIFWATKAEPQTSK